MYLNITSDKRFADLHYGARFRADRSARRAEDECKNHDLQHFALRHRIDDAGGEGVFENLRNAGAGLRDSGSPALLQLDADAGFDQIHSGEADKERNRRNDLKIKNCFSTDAPHCLYVARTGDA